MIETKKVIIFMFVFAILFFAIGIIVSGKFSKRSTTVEEASVVVNTAPTTALSGRVFRIAEQQKQEILARFSPFGVSNNFSGVMIQDTSSDPDGLAQYYLGYDVSEKNNTVLASLQSGSCVDLYVTEIKRGLVADYFDRINLLSIESVKPRTDLDCYLEFGNDLLQENPENKKITSQIYSAERGAYDIGYDYVIKIPWRVAETMGYSDSTGLSKDPNEIAEIIITAANTVVSKEIEISKRDGKKVTLEGTFGWGYAETMTFAVTKVID